MRKSIYVGLVLALITVSVITGLNALTTSADTTSDSTVKVTVLGTYNFTALNSYMYNESSKVLESVNTTYVKVEPYEIQDLSSSDSVEPAVIINLSAPTTDLNTNETIEYAYVLHSSYGNTLIIGVADINSTDNSVANLTYYKISPVSGDIAITRTSYDISIQGNGYKLSIPLSNFTDPKILLMTDSDYQLSSIVELELRALTNPPSGYTLIRSGTGPSTFTISASGILYVWFDESHQGGDLDLFVFDQSNSYYNDASNTQTWSWLLTHANAYIFADGMPQTNHIQATGTVKFVVKTYSGNGNAVSWRVAAELGNGSGSSGGSSPTSPQPSTTTTQSSGSNQSTGSVEGLSGLWHNFQSAVGGSTTAYIIVFLFLLIIIVAIAAGRK